MEWPESDQEKALVWLTEQRLRCPDCGQRPEESDPSKGGSLTAYHVEKYTCFTCKNIEDAYSDERKWSKRRKIRAGFKVRLIPNLIYQERKRLRKQMAVAKVRADATEKQSARLERTGLGRFK